MEHKHVEKFPQIWFWSGKRKLATVTMPKEEKKGSVFGRAPRKALGVKKAVKAGAVKKETKAAVPAALAAPASILRSPRSASATPPSSPVAETRKKEEWRLGVATLAARIDVERAELRALKDRVRQMEEAMGLSKTDMAEDARAAEDARPAPTSLFGE